MKPERRACTSCGESFDPSNSFGNICPACMLSVGSETTSLEDTAEISTGSKVSGYEIVSRLGVGGMGVVYEAVQLSLRRVVALKMVRAPSAASHKDMARFRQEAEAAARLNHPNIVEVYEIGELNDTPYFTMRYVEGARSLASELANGAVEPEKAARLVCEIAQAIGYAHHRGVLHRDLKPANILLDSEDRPCIVDFGLAKLFDASPSAVEAYRDLSEDGNLIGTPCYMSPEQVSGEDLTTATDVYSLGIVLYELLTGSPPFRSKSLKEILRKVSEDSPKSPRHDGKRIPRDLEVICLKCLRKDPDNRYGTADDLADDLDRWLNQKPILARPTSAAGRLAKWARRNPGIALLSTAVVVLAATTIVLLKRTVKDFEELPQKSFESYLSEALALEKEVTPGRLWEALGHIEKAADANKGVADKAQQRENLRALQNEALYWLSRVDLRLPESGGDSWTGDPDLKGLVRFSSDYRFYAHLDADGNLNIKDREFKEEIQGLEPLLTPDGFECVGLQFNNGKDQPTKLAAVYRSRGTLAQHQLVVWSLELGKSIIVFSVNGPEAFDFNLNEDALVLADGVDLILHEFSTNDTRRWETSPGHRPEVVRLDQGMKFVATGASDIPDVSLFDLTEEVWQHPVRVGPKGILDMAWNPQGRWLAIADGEGIVRILDTQGGISELSKKDRDIKRVAWHPRGVLVAGTSIEDGARSGEERVSVHLWHVIREEHVAVWDGEGRLNTLQFSPEKSEDIKLGPLITKKGTISLLDVEEGRVVSLARGHPDEVYGAWWWDSGQSRKLGRLFSTVGDDGVRLWNRGGFEKAYLDQEDGARAAIFTQRSLMIASKRGVSIRSVTGGTGNQIQLGPPNLSEGEPPGTSDDPPLWASWNPDHQELAVVAGGEIRLYQIVEENGSVRRLQYQQAVRVEGNPSHVAFGGKGNWLAVGTSDSTSKNGQVVQLWSRTTEPERDTWTPLDQDFEEQGGARVHFYQVPPIDEGDEAPKLEFFVTSDLNSYRFYVYVPKAGQWVEQWSEDSDPGPEPGPICFSPRLPAFATSPDGNYIKIQTMARTVLTEPKFRRQRPMTFSPLGFQLMNADNSGYLNLWDLRYLRTELKKLGIDFEDLPKEFPAASDLPEPNLIQEVIVD